MPFTIIRNDITKLHVDAIVNAANTELQMGGGVCGVIFKAAGADKLQNACNNLAPIQTGEAVITEGFNLLAKYIIHTAGPVYQDGKQGEEALLQACYTNSLELAVRYECESIAFPLISSGIYGYPKAGALSIATNAIRDFISEHDLRVSLVVFDKEAFQISKELVDAVKSYIDEHYVEERELTRRELLYLEEEALADEGTPKGKAFGGAMIKEAAFIDAKLLARSAVPTAKRKIGAKLDDIIGNLDEPFSVMLFRLINVTGRKEPEIYNRANIDRRLFSKIKNNADYVPSKSTVLAFAIALELTLDQTEDLLERAGFALSHSRKFDVIIEYFIQNRKYDIFEINEVLFSYDQPLLGG